jgi:hypothetical protein
LEDSKPDVTLKDPTFFVLSNETGTVTLTSSIMTAEAVSDVDSFQLNEVYIILWSLGKSISVAVFNSNPSIRIKKYIVSNNC